MSNQDGDYRNEGNFQLQSLVLDDVTPATRLLEKRRQMYEVCVFYAGYSDGQRL